MQAGITKVTKHSLEYHSRLLRRLSSSTAVGNAQVNEHRKLFGYAARGKQPKKGKSFAKQKVQTCSLKFVCLASRSAVKPPTTIKERTMLANACLGDGTVTFHVDGNSSHLHEKLLEAFPKLFSAGYELFLFDRSGENSSFCHLKPPYLPKKLKEVAGQCKIYIKPLQKELLDSNDNEDIEVQCGILCLIIALIYAFFINLFRFTKMCQLCFGLQSPVEIHLRPNVSALQSSVFI